MRLIYYVVFLIIGVFAGGIGTNFLQYRKTEGRNIQMNGLQKNLDMLNQWLILKQMNISLDSILKQKNIHTIAIYGMGINGRHLIRELEKSEVKVCYGIDTKVKGSYKAVPVYKLGKGAPSVDAVVNTVSYDEQNIRKALQQYYTCSIFSLDELIFKSFPTEGMI